MKCISSLNSQACGLPSVWALLSLLYLKSTRFDTSVTSSSSSAPFLVAVLSSVDWGVLIFSPLRPWLGVWQHRGESSGKSFSQILQQFYYARGERKAQSVLLPGWNWLLVKPVKWCQQGLSLPRVLHFLFIPVNVLLVKSQTSPTLHPQKFSKVHLLSQEYFTYLADNLILWERHWLLQHRGQTLIAGRQAPLIFLALRVYY